MAKADVDLMRMINDLAVSWKISAACSEETKKTVQNHPDFARFFSQRSGCILRLPYTRHGLRCLFYNHGMHLPLW